jgi:two-component system chemotaxis sensor kinase CheA
MELDRALLLRSFCDESDELLAELERLALDLDADPSKRSLVEEMFRCAHTLKGSASCVGFERVMALAHDLESLFESITTNRRSADRRLCGLTLEAVDLLRRGCSAADEARDAPLAGADELSERIQAWLAEGQSTLPLAASWRAPVLARCAWRSRSSIAC